MVNIRGQSFIGIVIVIGIIALLSGSVLLFSQKPSSPDIENLNQEVNDLNLRKITSFEECVAAGYQILEFTPRQCYAGIFGMFTDDQSDVGNPCAAVLCPANKICRNGICVAEAAQNPCAWTKCQAGYRCDWGKCIKQSNSQTTCNSNSVCTSGQRCVGGTCKQDTCTDKCPIGSACKNGRCDYCAFTDCFDPNTTCVDGQCVQKNPAPHYGCRVPCTGMVPSAEVSRACGSFTTETQCSSYQSSQFPFRCEWKDVTQACPAYP